MLFFQSEEQYNDNRMFFSTVKTKSYPVNAVISG